MIPTQDWGLATLEGGDVMPIGNGTVLVGMGERRRARRSASSPPPSSQRCRDRVIVAAMPSCARRCTSTQSSPSSDRDCVPALPRHRRRDRRLLLPAEQQDPALLTSQGEGNASSTSVRDAPEPRPTERGGTRRMTSTPPSVNSGTVVPTGSRAPPRASRLAYDRNTYTNTSAAQRGYLVSPSPARNSAAAAAVATA